MPYFSISEDRFKVNSKGKGVRILIDIGHPGHVHLFRNFANLIIENGHSVLFTCREKEFEVELLKKYGFNFYSLGKKYRSVIGKILGLLSSILKYL